jgi:cytochrome P450
MAVVFNPLTPENRQDPYPHYHELRREDPVQKHPLVPVFVLTRYADVAAVLRDPRFSVDRTRSKLFQSPLSPMRVFGEQFRKMFLGMMLMRDPPDHTRLRNLVNKAFTPRVVEKLLPRIQAIADERMDEALERGDFDLVRDFAFPLPVTVIAEMLGVETGDRADFLRWSQALVALTEPTAILTPEAPAAAESCLTEMRAFFDGIVAERRARPREDLVGALVRAEVEGDRLDADELFAMCVLILVAGHETTTNLIGNAVLALLRHPDQRRRLAADPALMRPAVEEFLRFDSVVQATARIALEDACVAGVTIPKGEAALLVIGAANRDPAQFEEPDRLDLARADNRHLAFGQGAHFCLGAGLARAEAQLALATLLARAPRFDGDVSRPDWKPTTVLRGLRSLPLALAG